MPEERVSPSPISVHNIVSGTTIFSTFKRALPHPPLVKDRAMFMAMFMESALDTGGVSTHLAKKALHSNGKPQVVSQKSAIQTGRSTVWCVLDKGGGNHCELTSALDVFFTGFSMQHAWGPAFFLPHFKAQKFQILTFKSNCELSGAKRKRFCVRRNDLKNVRHSPFLTQDLKQTTLGMSEWN